MALGMGRVVFAAMLAAVLSAGAQAQDYPSRPVTVVVPFVSGGSTEIMARLIGQGLEAKLGKPVIVENKPGAGTVIGSNFVAAVRMCCSETAERRSPTLTTLSPARAKTAGVLVCVRSTKPSWWSASRCRAPRCAKR